MQLKDKYGVEDGVYITGVKRFSEGFDRGLAEGLVIVEADKEKIENVEQLNSIIHTKAKVIF